MELHRTDSSEYGSNYEEFGGKKKSSGKIDGTTIRCRVQKSRGAVSLG